MICTLRFLNAAEMVLVCTEFGNLCFSGNSCALKTQVKPIADFVHSDSLILYLAGFGQYRKNNLYVKKYPRIVLYRIF